MEDRRYIGYSPGSITVLFEIRDANPDPLRRGSRGVGIAISPGALTEVIPGDEVSVHANGAPLEDSVQEVVLRELGVRGTVRTTLSFPISRGLGMSAAAALSTAVALAPTLHRAGAAAHVAEIVTSRGLGDVATAMTGGVTLRRVEGVPPHGVVDRLLSHPPRLVLLMMEGEMDTRDVLRNPDMRRAIARAAGKYVDAALSSGALCEIVRIGRRFAEDTGLLSRDMRDALEEISDVGYGSMAFLGPTLFAFGDVEEIEARWRGLGTVMKAEVDIGGPRRVGIAEDNTTLE